MLVVSGARDTAGIYLACDPTDPDADEDGLPNSCDHTPTDYDGDDDKFLDSLERYVGTDPLDTCSFPPDIVDDDVINIVDVFQVLPPYFGMNAEDPLWRAARDLYPDEVINITDVFRVVDRQSLTCPWASGPPDWSGVWLRSGTAHFPLAPAWNTLANVYVENDALHVTTCDEVKRATDHWSNNAANFPFHVGLTGNCNTSSNVRIFFRGVSRDPEFTAQVIPYNATLRECTDTSPCNFAYWADILLNRNHPRLTGEEIFRHTVLTHELGHIVGQGHTPFFPACQEEPYYTIMGIPPPCLVDYYNIHRVLPNDIVFTNIKY